MRHLLAMEKLALASLLLAAGMALVFRLQFYFPSGDAVLFICRHYLGPLLPALAVPAIMFMCYRAKPRTVVPFGQRLRAIGAFAVIVYLHCNLKLWAQLINPVLFDGNRSHPLNNLRHRVKFYVIIHVT